MVGFFIGLLMSERFDLINHSKGHSHALIRFEWESSFVPLISAFTLLIAVWL